MSDTSIGALQGALAVSGAYLSRIDGIIGPMTKRAIRAKPQVARSFAEKLGDRVLVLVEEALAPEPTNSGVLAAIADACREFGVPYDIMLAKAKIESALNPKAVNKLGYRGLFQMGQTAWSDAEKIVRSKGFPSLGTYSVNSLDALQNSRAACAYRLALLDQLASYGIVNPEEGELYLAHQQGAYGYSVLKRAADGRPITAGDLPRAQRAMETNPPQDGRGVTYVPGDFINRWVQVVQRRLDQAA